MEDIIIRNGLIVDVENEKIAKGDISVKDGKIVKVCSYIEEHAVVSEKITTDRPVQVIGLSTCADARTNGRVIVFGRLEKIS